MIMMIFVVAVFVILVAVSFYYSSIPYIFKYINLALFAVMAYMFFEHYVDSLGTPIRDYPKQDFLYVHHVINGDNTITLWVVHSETNRSRLYVIPYDRETAKTLGDAEFRTQQQRSVHGTFEQTEDGSRLQIGEWQGHRGEVDEKK